MTTYVAKRLLLMIPTLFGVSLVVWVVLSLAPDPPIEMTSAQSAEGGQTADRGEMSQAVKVFRAQYGLDRPALLNWYFDVDPAEVERTIRVAAALDGEPLEARIDAREQLIEWGYYAVPALVSILERSEGALRDETLRWTLQAAQRVTRVPPGGRVDPETAAENEEIVRENELLETIAWERAAPPARKEAGVAALRAWLDGTASVYPAGAPAAEVRAALVDDDGARFEAWGAAAVAPLVEIALADPDLAREAVARLAESARRPLPDDPAAAARVALQNELLGLLPWRPGAPDWQREGALALVRTWWEGARSRWDYSGLARVRVLLLETQFARYWANLFRLDLGSSTIHKRPVLELVGERIKYSMSLALPALLLAFLVSVPLGMLSATLHGTWTEKGMAILVFALYSLPTFFTATLLIRYLAEGQPGSAGIIPAGDFESVDAWQLPTTERLKHILKHLAAPLFCMTYVSLAVYSRYAKTGLLNVIRSDYVRTARAKGVREFWVVVKHAARNGIIPIVTLLGSTLPVVIGGAFVIEFIFRIPGFGLLSVEAVKGNDYNVVVGTTLITAVLVMLGILLSDLLYAAVDPRISLS